MLTLQEAQNALLEDINPLPTEWVKVENALGRVLAISLLAERPLPPFDSSAMDGYAIYQSSLLGAKDSPISLAVANESRAGRPSSELRPGTACRIFTGAPIPSGADTVVMQEDVSLEEGIATFNSVPNLGQHIRRAGEDLPRGAVAILAGKRLAPFDLSLAASLDETELEIYRRPRIAIIATGDELRPAGSPAFPGSIPDSNGHSIRAMIHALGGEVSHYQSCHDKPADIRRAIRESLDLADVILTIGGVSVGEYDHVKNCLQSEGAELVFWKVAIKPGKPVCFGKIRGKQVLCLPGNPVSSQLAMLFFGIPLIRKLMGESTVLPQARYGKLVDDFQQKPGRQALLRAQCFEEKGERLVRVHRHQSSGSAASMAHNNAIVSIPAESSEVKAGELVEIYPYRLLLPGI